MSRPLVSGSAVGNCRHTWHDRVRAKIWTTRYGGEQGERRRESGGHNRAWRPSGGMTRQGHPSPRRERPNLSRQVTQGNAHAPPYGENSGVRLMGRWLALLSLCWSGHVCRRLSVCTTDLGGRAGGPGFDLNATLQTGVVVAVCAVLAYEIAQTFRAGFQDETQSASVIHPLSSTVTHCALPSLAGRRANKERN